jgi:hypothetical protein
MDNAKDTARRRAPRLALRVGGSLSGRSAREVTLVDLSLTGCLVRCPALLDHGAILDLHLELEEGPLATKVRVSEASLDGESAPGEPLYLTGLEFLGLPPKDAVRLRRLLDEERRRRSADAPAH